MVQITIKNTIGAAIISVVTTIAVDIVYRLFNVEEKINDFTTQITQ